MPPTPRRAASAAQQDDHDDDEDGVGPSGTGGSGGVGSGARKEYVRPVEMDWEPFQRKLVTFWNAVSPKSILRGVRRVPDPLSSRVSAD